MLIWTGTATVTNADATVVVDTGAALTAEIVAYGAMVVLDGVVYFADSLTATTTLELTRVYAGVTGTVDMEIWPVSQDTTNLVNLAQIVARTQAQINILDKNSQGLFFNMKGVTGAADPGPGFIAFDDDDAALVTEAYVDALDANGRAVSELVGLWEAGTTIVVRSLTTTAYRAYTVATNIEESGWTKLALTYIGYDGVLADNEALAVSWIGVAAGLEISASGNFADRDLYDDAPAGFVFLSADGDGGTITVGALFRKNSGTTADWGPAVPFQGPQGDKGWSPVFGTANDDARQVLRIVGFIGGEGSPPSIGSAQYLSPGGLTSNIASATDVRGIQGLSAYEVAVVNGFAGTQSEWLATLVGASAYQVAVAAGFVGTEEEWLESLNGADGTDPGALFNWDDGTADADPGAGNLRADSAELSAAAFLYVSKVGRTGDDLEAFLLGIGASTNTIKGHVTLTNSGGTAQAIIRVVSLTDATGYVKVGLQASTHAGVISFVDATPISLQFSLAGNQGAADEVSMASAINGSPEVSDPAAATKFAITDPNNGDLLSWISFESLGNAIKPRALVDAQTVNYTVLTTDLGKNLNIDASAAARTITLPPTATAGNGFEIGVRKSDSSTNTVTIDGDGAETVNGSATLVLRAQREAVRLVCNGTTWQVVSTSGVTDGDKGGVVVSDGGTVWTPKEFTGDAGAGGAAGTVPAPSAGDAADGKVLGAGGSWIKPATVPRGHIFGLGLSNNATDAANDIDVAEGEAASANTQPSLLTLTAATTKRFDAAWAAGAGNGGRFTSGSADGWYYLFLIGNPSTGDIDVGFSDSQTDPTGGANYPAGFSLFRYIGPALRQAGAFRPFAQTGNRFIWSVAADDGATIACATSRTLAAVTAPPNSLALVRSRLSNGTTATNLVLGDAAASLSLNANEASLSAAASGNAAGEFQLRTNSGSQIAHRASNATGSPTFNLRTYGWIDDALSPSGAPLASAELRKIACAFRYNGSALELISDANHEPIGVASVARFDTGGGNYVARLTYDFTAAKVAGMIAGADEAFAGTYHPGASVGLTYADIYIRNASGTLIDPHAIGTGGNFWVLGEMVT